MRILQILFASALSLSAQTFSMNAFYSCDSGRTKVKVTGCTGTGDADLCGVEHLNTAGTAQIGPKTSEYYKSIAARLATCQLQPRTPPAATAPHPPASQPAAPQQAPQAIAAPPRQVPAQQVGGGGIKVGDTVSVLTGFGWIDGRVLAVRGNSFYVHSQTGVDVWKDYPSEVHRLGAPTAADHAAGIYQLHDRVQVNVAGQWLEGTIVTTMGMDYQVQLPGNRVAWVQPQNLRPSTAPPPTAPKPAQSPKGLASCAGRFEGRYSTTFGGGAYQFVFRSGKVSVKFPLSDEETLDCFYGGGKIYLRKPGEPDLTLDINDDGTIDGPWGEFKKKGN